jgi:hypothetical protein
MALVQIEPIYLWDGYTSRGIIDVEGASRFLVQKWPEGERRGRAYRDAIRACMAALEGNGTAEAAREAVLSAAEENSLVDRKAMDAVVPVPSGKKRVHWR